MPEGFAGFTLKTLQFLRDIRENNRREWYAKNKERYRQDVLAPFQSLVASLSRFMLEIDSDFETRPAVNRTISRIYRDTRFSGDKSPFRSNVWIAFKIKSSDWKEYPTFFFELFPDYYRYGMGYYEASRPVMEIFRGEIDRSPEDFFNLVKNIPGAGFELRGEMYKRLYRGRHKPEIQTWYQRKSFYLCKDCEIDEVLFSEKLPIRLQTDFGILKPLYYFLRNIHFVYQSQIA